MMKHGKRVLIVFSMCCLALMDAGAQTITNKNVLEQTRLSVKQLEKSSARQVLAVSSLKGWSQKRRGINSVAYLTGIDAKGYPLYTTTTNNIVSAATIGANLLWPGGNGLNLNGSSSFINGRLGLWDLGQPRTTHVEFTGRILLKETSSTE
ncbi:MAG: hypothetical protein ABI687_05900, partial [Flavitalea sp.]